MTTNAYRNGRVHVVSEKCSTCVFRPGNLMRLQPGRVKGMVDDSIADGGAITCHKTLYVEPAEHAVCSGFWESYRDQVRALVVAERMNLVTFVEPVVH